LILPIRILAARQIYFTGPAGYAVNGRKGHLVRQGGRNGSPTHFSHPHSPAIGDPLWLYRPYRDHDRAPGGFGAKGDAEVEPLTQIAAYLAGLLLRIAIPLGVTAVLVWLLRRVDAHWKEEAQYSRPRPAQSNPCWALRRCPTERRAACPAFLQHEVPCWQLFRDEGGHLREACLTCPVFRTAPVPAGVQARA
jgi:hypothetical protein